MFHLDHSKNYLHRIALLAASAILAASAAAAQENTPVYFQPNPGPAQAHLTANSFSISNSALRATWQISNNKFAAGEFRDLLAQKSLGAPVNPFVLLLSDGRVLTASDMKVTSAPTIENLKPNPNASKLSERIPGKEISVQLHDDASQLSLTWHGILRDGSAYIRQEITLSAKDQDVAIREVRLIDWIMPDAHVAGQVRGSPVVDGTVFIGFEHPLIFLRRRAWPRPLQTRSRTAIAQRTRSDLLQRRRCHLQGQLRRGFLNYVERERAHPYRTFLHYNSWYDLGYFKRYDEAQALDVVRAFGTELTEKRGVKLSSFLFDDGWDDPATLWKFNAGFPDGLSPSSRRKPKNIGAEPGIWMSPWGGYGEPRQQRLAAARAAGYEIVDTRPGAFRPEILRAVSRHLHANDARLTA